MKKFLTNFYYWLKKGYSVRLAWKLAGKTF